MTKKRPAPEPDVRPKARLHLAVVIATLVVNAARLAQSIWGWHVH